MNFSNKIDEWIKEAETRSEELLAEKIKTASAFSSVAAGLAIKAGE